MKTSVLRNLGLTAALALVALPALAGGPLAVCQSGVPYLWPNGGTNIVFNPDQGDLGPVPGAAAIALVDSAFQVWEDIPSATMTYAAGALLPVDVDITNFNPYLNPVAPDGLSAVVFDDTGEIFDLLFGSGTGILGFAGPEWVNTVTCDINEGLSFLNGPSFTNATAALDVMVHEFGHWTNFAHTVVNGQIYLAGDTSGPTPNDTFGPAPAIGSDVLVTMYPFYFGPGSGTQTVAADDIAIASRMYPEPDYAATTGEIAGTIFFGTQKVTGVNVIARNFADPFHDAVSAISSDFTDATDQADPNVGVYRITGLTPGADYGVYVDEVLAGGFSTTLSSPLPGAEDGWNADEASTNPPDDPSVVDPIAVAAGSPVNGIDIYFNLPGEGDPLGVGDDGTVQLPLPFTFCMQGESYDSVFVNANGNVTFGAGDTDFSESDAEFLDGPPRVAGMWHDLNPAQGGSVFYTTDNDSFTVTWEDVPEWFATGANTFDITLHDNSSVCAPSGDDDSDSDGNGRTAVEITHRSMDLTDGLVGVSGGIPTTSGVEAESDLSALSRNFRKKIKMKDDAAIWENYIVGDGSYDLEGESVTFNLLGKAFEDDFEDNDSLADTAQIDLPFVSTDTKRSYTAIAPPAGDIDFYEFGLDEGQTLIAQITRGQLDSVMGIWYCGDDGDSDSDAPSVCDPNTAIFIGFNDDVGFGANPLLSGFLFSVPLDGTYAIGVTFCCDYDFDGVDAGQGAPFDGGRYILDLQVIDGTLITLGDDNFVEVTFDGGFTFPFNGTSYSSAFVNSNGNLTFGSGDSSFTNFIENVGDFLAGPPRVSPLWDDLSPNNGGFVYYNQAADSFTVTFQDVPEFISTGANTFSVTLGGDGSVDMDYGEVSALDALVGVTEGNGAADPGSVDLSAAAGLSAVGTTYELFDGFSKVFDLPPGTVLTYLP